MATKLTGFWNDSDGLTVVEILAIALGIGSAALYWHFGCLDSNFADIVVASILGAAGQKVGYKFAAQRRVVNEGTFDSASCVTNESKQSN